MTDYTRFGTTNMVLPKEGPKTYPFTLDFRLQGEQQIDLTLPIEQGEITSVQSMFVNNFNNDNALVVKIAATGQKIHFPANKQGYLPILVSDSPQLTFNTTVDINLLVPVQIMNFPSWPIIF